mmetsp:Transcript_29591/g.36012  ORF Transcript_29591/g.36012 Transcript_29591/m.36012 type:complete len:101 (-) Transcript_29591:4-306(-)
MLSHSLRQSRPKSAYVLRHISTTISSPSSSFLASHTYSPFPSTIPPHFQNNTCNETNITTPVTLHSLNQIRHFPRKSGASAFSKPRPPTRKQRKAQPPQT